MAGQRKMKIWLERDEDGNLPPIDDKKRERITQRAWNYSIWAITNAPKTAKQLSDKMREKGCPEDIIEATLEKLAGYGYINDADFAVSFVESKRTAGWGSRRIAMELQRRGVEEEHVETALAVEGWGGETEEDRAREFAQKKVRSFPASLERRKKTDRLVRGMVSRGFDMGLAFQMANELIVDTPAEDD